jgi:hypothetical protein
MYQHSALHNELIMWYKGLHALPEQILKDVWINVFQSNSRRWLCLGHYIEEVRTSYTENDCMSHEYLIMRFPSDMNGNVCKRFVIIDMLVIR